MYLHPAVTFYLPEDTSEASWQQTRDGFQAAYEYIYQAILNFDETKLDELLKAATPHITPKWLAPLSMTGFTWGKLCC